ncbi:recombinase family protein [Staphylococcus haemolyticus]|uniref:recombinase family protein n=1 Tax=Staphylococcus haemolyticus TaxID=1283 RepID=UPI000871FABB|nr:recombinase family protein [Staphylococcus haemolyticus]MBF2217032.1 recombinase family protein [Staphylococcus haemolyticus]MBF2221920.1 recombinase family protein [Staphylococcus haemolyticus]MCH4507310.1 recombinase family protein [Staphylococcus haemolyticus]MCK6070307.1 recombinase family protein [Staphylococcus haemolyticus]MCK6112207.1 recombinase family protein [Staphylococcus haemolyticus]
MKKVIGYARQSVDKKKTENSVHSQIKAIKTYANKHKIQNVNFISDVKSGRSTTRTGYQSMLNTIRKGECQHIIVFRINRLNRNFKDFMELQALCEEHHVLITSLSDGQFDLSDKTQAFKIRCLAILGETESRIISENVRSANALKARNNQLLGTNAPFGYIYMDKSFHIDQSKVATIQFIFNSYVYQGWGYKKISQALAIQSSLYHRTPKQVNRIITNEKYAGLIRNHFGEYKGQFEPIIEESLFRKAEAIRASKKTLTYHHPIVLLRKKIRCTCGTTMTPIRMNRKHMTRPITYYVCPLNERIGYKKCDMGYFVASKIDECVINIIEDNVINQQMLQRLENAIHSKLALKIKRSQPNYNQDQIINQLSKQQISIKEYKDKLNKIETWHRKMDSYKLITSTAQLNQITHNILTNYTLYMDQLSNMITQVTVNQYKEITGVFLKDSPLNLLKVKDDKNVN